MGRFDAIRFREMTADRQDLDEFSAKSKNMRFNVPTEKTIVLTSADENNLPGLAHTYLQDKSLWWVLLEYNGLYDPINDVKAGTVMKIPSRRALIQYLETSEDKATNVII